MPSNLQGNVSYTDPDFERDPTSIVLGARTGLTGETVLGSHPLVPLRRKDDDEPVPDPDAPPPPPPPPPVSVPELALQFRPCLSDIPSPGFDLEAAVIEAVNLAAPRCQRAGERGARSRRPTHRDAASG